MSETIESYLKKVESIRVKDYMTISLNTEFLSENFELIKQCLKKVHELQNQVHQSKKSNQKTQKDIYDKINLIEKQSLSQKGEINDLKNNVGENLMAKFAQIEKKSNNSQDLNQLIRKIQQLNKFVLLDTFNSFEAKNKEDLTDINKLKDNFERCVDHNIFNQFKQQTASQFNITYRQIDNIKESQKTIQSQIDSISEIAKESANNVNENNKMMKQINFVEMQQKMRKHKEDTDNKIGQMILKIKKKISGAELGEMEKCMVERIDGYLNNMNKADKTQTKEALLFLQKRINQLFELMGNNNEDQQDSLFATRKWMCGSCSKDLGKYEGKLGQFRPWAVFPCKEMNPEQSGGFGYMNYIEKISQRKGNSIDDLGMDRLNRTFQQRTKELSPSRKLNSTKTTNFMSNYGQSQEYNSVSLKEEYFKFADKEKGTSSKTFRVKKDNLKQGLSQKVKPQQQ